MWCSHLRPHSPYDPPQAFWDMYINRDLPPVPVGDWAQQYGTKNPGLDMRAWHGRLTDEQLHRMRVGYMGNVTHLDYELGSLIRTMDAMDIVRDTLFVFVADHGDMQGDHNMLRKTYAYEGSARIPFVVRYPHKFDMPSGTFDHVVGIQDVMPTILDVCDVPIPESVTGSSVLNAVRGETWRDYIHGEHSPCYSRDEAMHYLTDGREKYIWLPLSNTERLFDLTTDRSELYNLADDPTMQGRVSIWRERLVEILRDRGDGFVENGKLVPRTDWWPPDVEGDSE
jgi:arylsulfatase